MAASKMTAGRNIAVVGAGISGMSAAWQLDLAGHQVCLFEKRDRIGGHTHTHEVIGKDGPRHVDSGFIIFNEDNYPNFSAWLGQLGVASQPTDMSFAVRDDVTGYEYGTRSLSAVLGVGAQCLKPGYLRMWRDLLRFYRELGSGEIPDLSLGEYLRREGYSESFAMSHMMPMCSALWSQPNAASSELSLRHVIEFMRNHKLLQIMGRPEWQVVQGGSASYVDRFVAISDFEIVTGSGDMRILRNSDGVTIEQFGSTRSFDAVVLACHSDEALALLDNPTNLENEVLTNLPYQNNAIFLHSDSSFMPRDRRCWSSWNVMREEDGSFTTTYWMNRLQTLAGEDQYFVTLNPQREPRSCHWQGDYSHPHFTRESCAAKARWAEISCARTYYAGAYWGAGFHEDGFVSGKRCAHAVELEVRDVA